MIVVTGATGQLGRLVIDALRAVVPASHIVAAVRNPERAADLAAQGVQVRRADYSEPESLDAAFEGADRLLLISSSEVGQRTAQHRNVIEAARRTRVSLLAYTSLLHADTSPLSLAAEHRATEAMLSASGVPHVLLRNGWYTENLLGRIATALSTGILVGAAGAGRIASAARADYAAAAAVVLTRDGQQGKIYELAGDEAYTLVQFTAELSRQAGRAVTYQDMAPDAYSSVLEAGGLPKVWADLLTDFDVGTAAGALFDQAGQLRELIGRPTTPLPTMIAHALG